MLILLAITLASASTDDAEATIAAAFGDTEDYLPADYNRVMKIAESLGDRAVRPLAARIVRAKDANQLFYLCQAATRIPHRDFLEPLQLHFDHPEWLARSSCGAAFAASAVALGDGDALAAVWTLVEEDDNCTVTRNVSSVMGGFPDRGTWTTFEQQLFSGTSCERQAALGALANYPECDDHIPSAFVEILTDPRSSLSLKESAAHALVGAEWPGARLPLLALLAGEDPGGNVRAFAVQALIGIGRSEDIPMLKKIIADDPYDGEGVWAVHAREAIKAIRAREVAR